MTQPTTTTEDGEKVFFRPPEELVDLVERCGSILFGGVFNKFIQYAAIEYLKHGGYLTGDPDVALPTVEDLKSSESANAVAVAANAQLGTFLKKRKGQYAWRCGTEVYELLAALVSSPEHRLPEPLVAKDIRRFGSSTRRDRRLTLSAGHVVAMDRCVEDIGGERRDFFEEAVVFKADKAGLRTGVTPALKYWPAITGRNLTELAWASVCAAQVLRTDLSKCGVAGQWFERRLKQFVEVLEFSSTRLL